MTLRHKLLLVFSKLRWKNCEATRRKSASKYLSDSDRIIKLIGIIHEKFLISNRRGHREESNRYSHYLDALKFSIGELNELPK